MPKGYIIARVTVKDADQYARYTELATIAIEKFGAKPIIRGGRYIELEGPSRPRNVVMEFESYDAALAYYNSEDYQRAKVERVIAADAEVIVVEGADEQIVGH